MVWHSSITEGQVLEIERVQRVALRIILKYVNYDKALERERLVRGEMTFAYLLLRIV